MRFSRPWPPLPEALLLLPLLGLGCVSSGAHQEVVSERDALGSCPVGASTSDEAIYRGLLLDPLEALGLRITDVDRFAPELHNSEIMVHSGSSSGLWTIVTMQPSF